ncbi:MAG: hypothetical protein JXA22_10870, partial [Candidatus Thermoplasmatota archaeon]|nr:hypothetical protein [Candidatus Thermoplasmatota archaeon]
MDWTLNRNEIRILQLMASGDRKWSIKAISETIGVSPPWVSESVAHMRKMCILDVVRAGMTLEIKVSENDLGNAICKLMIENKQLNFERVLCGSSLRILPHLVTNRYSMNNIAEKSGLSYRTVMDYCNRWHRMGV